MAHALWNGTLSFGLLQIPVTLHSNEKKKELDFNLVDRRDHSPIGYRRVNKRTGEEVDEAEIVRSYKLTGGDYLVVPEEEFRKAASEFTRVIRIVTFVPAREIRPVYFEPPYYLEPTSAGEKGYALLLDTLMRMEKAGIARVVLRHRERMAALIPDRALLTLNTLRFADELKHPKRLEEPAPDLESLGLSDRELDAARRLVTEMSSAWDPRSYRDEYRDKLLASVRKKTAAAAGEKPSEPAAKGPKPTPEGKLLSLLEQSLSTVTESKRRRGKIA
jgi:DNA end-binding protein Ku